MSQDLPPVSISPDAVGVLPRRVPSQSAPPAPPPSAEKMVPVFRELPPQSSSAPASLNNIDQLLDVELDVRIELGRTRMRLDELLKVSDGSVIELNRLADDPVDVFVNDRLVARGEVVVLNENFAVRVTEVISPIRALSEETPPP